MNKRVLIFSTAYFPLVGGAEVAVKEITDRLPDWHFDLVCARLRSGLPSREQIGNIMVYRCGFGKPMDKFLLPFFGWWKSLWLPRPAFVWSLMASFGGFAAWTYCLLHRRVKMVLTLQEGDPLERYDRQAGALSFLHKKIFQRANRIQAISTFLAQWGKRMGFRGEPVVIPNGVNVETFSTPIGEEERVRLRRELGYAERDCILVTASRLSLKNGIDDLIPSLAYLPASYHVLIIGEGEDREKLEALTKQRGLWERVLFLGKKSHGELPALLQASDIFVRASLSEGLGNSFLEAMAAGLPIIGTSVGGIPDFLKDGETGVFCQPHDPESIAKAALRIQQEPGLRERLIQNGRALVAQAYEWNNIAKRMDQLFLSLV